MAKKRWSDSISVSVDVDVDVSEVIDQISDEALLDECRERGISTNAKKAAGPDPEIWRDFANEFRAVMESGDRLHHEVLVIRMLAMAGVPRLTVPSKEKVSQ